jgi:hypothetical protein
MKAKRDTYYYSIKIGFKSGENIEFDTAEKNLQTDVHVSIRISNKRSQLAMSKADLMSEKFMRLATSERKKDKKRAFYAKHKNRK